MQIFSPIRSGELCSLRSHDLTCHAEVALLSLLLNMEGFFASSGRFFFPAGGQQAARSSND